MALGQIYTLDLRLEQRILTLHVTTEFWMIEPEAF
jgi:hypothetical protein